MIQIKLIKYITNLNPNYNRVQILQKKVKRKRNKELSKLDIKEKYHFRVQEA